MKLQQRGKKGHYHADVIPVCALIAPWKLRDLTDDALTVGIAVMGGLHVCMEERCPRKCSHLSDKLITCGSEREGSSVS